MLNQWLCRCSLQCLRENAQWSCGEAELETRLKLSTHELLVRPGTVKPELAMTAVKKIASYGYFQGQSLDLALQSTCNMGMGDRPDLVEISCKNWTIHISFWCPQNALTTACPRVIYLAEKRRAQ